MTNETKEKIKGKIKELKEKLKHKKIEGDPDIPGVKEFKRLKPKKVKEDKDKESRKKEVKDKGTKRPVVVGPRGGRYKVAPTGRKEYEHHKYTYKSENTLDMLKSIVRDEFIEKFKRSKNND